MIFFACPTCRKPFAAKDELAGKLFPCPGCKAVIKAPVPPTFTPLPARPKPQTAHQRAK